MLEFWPQVSEAFGSSVVFVAFRLAAPPPDGMSVRDLIPHDAPVEGSFLSLGIDVVDASLFSPLANLRSFEEGDMKDKMSKLNDWGLAGSISDAEEMRADCEDEYPEHAPFALVELLVELKEASHRAP